MNTAQKTAIVTGASQGIGAGIVNAFVERECRRARHRLFTGDTPKDVMESLSPKCSPCRMDCHAS